MNMQAYNLQNGVLQWPPSDIQQPVAFFLVGPTASGKTELAHFLARQLSTAILSADSMLVYRGMDVGTAKPSTTERQEVPYFGIDVADPSESFSVGKYLQCAREAWAYCVSRQCALLVVGGTGLYIKCLTEGLAPAPAADVKLRKRAENILRDEGIEGLLRELKRADPERAQTMADPKNPRRLIRALELAWVGVPSKRTWGLEAPPTLVGLQWPSQQLAERIEQRVRKMFAAGLLDETARLLNHRIPFSSTARHAIGYKEAIAVLEGRMSLDHAIEQTIRRTRQLVKRQMTWFRHQTRVAWVTMDASRPLEHAAQKVVSLWKVHGSSLVHI